jgi:hypothetical protein
VEEGKWKLGIYLCYLAVFDTDLCSAWAKPTGELSRSPSKGGDRTGGELGGR